MIYDQPFCIIGSRGIFKGAHFGYLPALEFPATDSTLAELLDKIEVLEDAIVYQPIRRNEMDELKGELRHIHDSVHGLQARRKEKESLY